MPRSAARPALATSSDRPVTRGSEVAEVHHDRPAGGLLGPERRLGLVPGAEVQFAPDGHHGAVAADLPHAFEGLLDGPPSITVPMPTFTTTGCGSRVRT